MKLINNQNVGAKVQIIVILVMSFLKEVILKMKRIILMNLKIRMMLKV